MQLIKLAAVENCGKVALLRPLIREWLCKGTHFKVNLQVSSTNTAQRFLASHHYLNLFKFSHTVIKNISRKFSRHKHSIYRRPYTHKLGLIKFSPWGFFNSGVHFHALKNSWSILRSRREIKVDINKLTKTTKTLVVRLRRQQVLTCVPNLPSKPSVTCDTSHSNYNLHTVCNVYVISNGVFVSNWKLFIVTQEYEISPLI